MSTKTKRSFKQMTPQEFDKIKGLLGYGLTDAQVIKITGRSSATVYMIRQNKTYVDYKTSIREMTERSRLKKEQAVPKLVIPATEKVGKIHVMENGRLHVEQPQPEAPELRESLASIAHELKLLREAWEKPKAKGLFK
jgi:hypothetical protein